FVAVDRSEVANQGETLHRIFQPVEQPEGWDSAPAEAFDFSAKYCLSGPEISGLNFDLDEFADERWASGFVGGPPAHQRRGGRKDMRSRDRLAQSSESRSEALPPRPTEMQRDSAVNLPAPPPAAPDEIEVHEQVATGGFGAIFKGTDKRTGRPVQV